MEEDQFFQKWLKQRENLSSLRGGSDLTSTSQRNSTALNKGSQKKKDVTQKELDAIEEQIQQQQKLKGYKVEQVEVRKPLDVSTITAATIQAFIDYLNIGESEGNLREKLELTSQNRKSTRRTGQSEEVIEE